MTRYVYIVHYLNPLIKNGASMTFCGKGCKKITDTVYQSTGLYGKPHSYMVSAYPKDITCERCKRGFLAALNRKPTAAAKRSVSPK